MEIWRQGSFTVSETACSLLGGPGGAPFPKNLILRLRFQRKSQFLAENGPRLGTLSQLKLKVSKKLIPYMSVLIIALMYGITFFNTLSFNRDGVPSR